MEGQGCLNWAGASDLVTTYSILKKTVARTNYAFPNPMSMTPCTCSLVGTAIGQAAARYVFGRIPER
jgi:hypothetical protein